MGHGWKDPGALKCFSIQLGGLGNQWDVQGPKHARFQLPKKPLGTRGCFRMGDLGVSPRPPHPLPSPVPPTCPARAPVPKSRYVPGSLPQPHVSQPLPQTHGAGTGGRWWQS